MNKSTANIARQAGLSLMEMLVAMALGVSVMSGVVSVLVTSKANFVAEQELATLQENARYAIKFMSETILMAGYNGCNADILSVANSVQGASSSWYLNGTGLQGFDHEAPASFPAEFSADVAADTDALVVRRAENGGLSVNGNHNPNSAVLPLNKSHDIKPGTIMVVAAADCQQVGIFVVSGPTNNNNNALNIVHNTGTGNPPNCTKNLTGNFDCSSVGSSTTNPYPTGSSVMRLRSEAFYVGTSSVGNGIPALFREFMVLNTSTTTTTTQAEELVQGVENMQILYGLDNSFNDGLADIYLKANDAAMNWDNVVSVRLFLRMRSINPVYSGNETYSTFRGIAGTGGADRFMRHVVSTTVQLRN